MKQTQYYLSIAALVAVGTLLMGCNKLEEKEQPQENQSVTLATTLTLEGDDNTKALSEYGVKTFAEGDRIAVVYENTSSQTVKVVSPELETKDISNAGKSATISVTLTNPKANSQFKLIYPASMAKEDGSVNYEALNTQDGTLASLASLDLAVGEQTLNGTALPASVTLDNPLAICKFVIMNMDGSNIFNSIITSLTVGDGTNTYVVNRSAAGSPIYVAVKPVTSSAEITITAESASATYTKSVTGKPLNASNLYPINVKCQTTYTVLNGGEVLKVGDMFIVPDASWTVNQHFSFQHNSGTPFEVIQETLPGSSSTDEYYMLKQGNSTYFTENSYSLPVTNKSDGLLVTKSGDQLYSFSVHEIPTTFSVSSTQKVLFARSNLRATTSDGWDHYSFSFMDNPWDVIETMADPYCTDNYGDKTAVSLFGRTTSGYNGRHPYWTSQEKNDYTYTINEINGSNYDWGHYNAIGTDPAGTWRTPTRNEWKYVLNADGNSGRNDSYRFAKGTVHNVNGLIIFPDGFDPSKAGVTISNANSTGAGFTSYTNDEWTKMESAGCVFLPVAGVRYGTKVIGGTGDYWSGTKYDNSNAYYLEFFNSGMFVCSTSGLINYRGISVRLVRDVVSL